MYIFGSYKFDDEINLFFDGSVAKEFEPQTYEKPEPSVYGRTWAYLRGHGDLAGVVVAALNPGQKKIDSLQNRLEAISSDNKCSIFVNKVIDFLQHMAEEGGLEGTFLAGYASYLQYLQDDCMAKYLKHLAGVIFLSIGQKILDEKERESFDSSEELMTAVINHIFSEVTSRLDKIRSGSDEEIQREAEALMKLFLDDLIDNSGINSGILWFKKVPVKKGISLYFKDEVVNFLVKYFTYYRELSQEADEIKAKPQFANLEELLISKSINETVAKEVNLHKENFMCKLEILFDAVKDENGLPLFPKTMNVLLKRVVNNVVSEQIVKQKPLLDDFKSIIFGSLVDFDDETETLQEKTKEALDPFMTILESEILASRDILSDLRDLYEKPDTRVVELQNTFILEVLRQRLESLDKKKYKLREKETNIDIQKKIEKFERLFDQVERRIARLTGEEAEVINFGEKLEYLETVSIDEVDWSSRFKTVVDLGGREELKQLMFDLVMVPCANKVINKFIREKLNGKFSKELEQELMTLLRVSSGSLAHELANLSEDMNFFKSDHQDQVDAARAYLRTLDDEKGEALLTFLDTIVDSILSSFDKPTETCLITHGIGAAFKEMKNPSLSTDDTEVKFADDLLKDLAPLLAQVVLQNAEGATFEAKAESLLKGILVQFENACEELVGGASRDEVILNLSNKIVEVLLPPDQTEAALPLILPRISERTATYEAISEKISKQLKGLLDPYFEVIVQSLELMKALERYSTVPRENSDPETAIRLEVGLLDYGVKYLNHHADYLSWMDDTPGILDFLHQLLINGAYSLAANELGQEDAVVNQVAKGTIRSILNHVVDAMPHVFEDPTFIGKAVVKVSDLTAAYLKDELNLDEYRDIENFADTLADQILDIAFLNGKDDLPVDPSIQESTWNFVRKSIISEINALEDPQERKKLILNFLLNQCDAMTGEITDRRPFLALDEDGIKREIEDATTKFVFLKILSSIPSLFKTLPFRILFAPLIWIVSLIIARKAKSVARELLEASDRDDFNFFLRKLIRESLDLLVKEKFRPLKEDVKDKELQKNARAIFREMRLINRPMGYIASKFIHTPQDSVVDVLNPTE